MKEKSDEREVFGEINFSLTSHLVAVVDASLLRIYKLLPITCLALKRCTDFLK